LNSKLKLFYQEVTTDADGSLRLRPAFVSFEQL